MQREHEDSLGMFWWLMLGFGFLLFLLFLWIWHGSRTIGRVPRATVQLIAFQTAITNFNAAAGHWPNSLTELGSNSLKTVFIAPPAAFRDPWGNPFIYVPFNSATGFGRVISLGRDGKPGGIGLDADIERRFP